MLCLVETYLVLQCLSNYNYFLSSSSFIKSFLHSEYYQNNLSVPVTLRSKRKNYKLHCLIGFSLVQYPKPMNILGSHIKISPFIQGSTGLKSDPNNLRRGHNTEYSQVHSISFTKSKHLLSSMHLKLRPSQGTLVCI